MISHGFASPQRSLLGIQHERPRSRLSEVLATTLVAGLLSFCLVLAFMVQAARAGQPLDLGAKEELVAGLFFKAGRPDAVFEAPVLESEVAIDINGQVARVTVRQRFQNPSNAWLEGVYVFPLPARSAVDRLVMTVGERRIEGRILEKAAAQKIYQAAAREGRKASLLSSHRPNVFVTSLANIGPGEAVAIEIQYQDRVDYQVGRFSYRFPMVVAPRYTPGGAIPLVRAPAPPEDFGDSPGPKPQAIAHDPFRLQPNPAEPARDLFGPVRHPDQGLANPVTLRVLLDAGLPLAELSSLAHDVAIEGDGQGRYLVTLSAETVPADRDFVLSWRPSLGAEPAASLFAEEVAGESHLLVSVLPPPADSAAEEGLGQPRDLILVVDTSGSMHGLSIEQAQAALLLALQRLTPRDRFNIIRFASDMEQLFDRGRAATPDNLRHAMAYVRALQADGGTEMQPALLAALDAPAEPGLLRQVVFLTDGAVSNEHQLFLTIAERLKDARLFTVGIGSAPNGFFMRKAAELGRGSFVSVGDLTEVRARTAALFRKLEQPALTDLAVTWPADLDGKVQMHPAVLPDLYADEPISFTLRLAGVPNEDLQGELVLSGNRAGRPWRSRLRLDKLRDAPGVAAIWARARFDELQDGLYRGESPEAVRTAALAVALRHQLVTSYTSLVAVDDVVSRPENANLETAEVARNLPHGMTYGKVFGEPQAVMPLRPLPESLKRDAAFRGEAIGMPQTATAAELLALAGLALLLWAAVLLVAGSRLRRAGI